MAFDTRGSVQTMPPFTCSKIEIGCLVHPISILPFDDVGKPNSGKEFYRNVS